MSERRGAGIEGAALRAAVAGHDQEPRDAPDLGRAGPARARAHRRRAGPAAGEGPGAAAGDEPRHELPRAAHPRARGLRGAPRPRLLRPRAQALGALPELPGAPRPRGGRAADGRRPRRLDRGGRLPGGHARRRDGRRRGRAGVARAAPRRAGGRVHAGSPTSRRSARCCWPRAPPTRPTTTSAPAASCRARRTRSWTGARSSRTSPRRAQRGYAVELEELAVGCCCVAAPVLDADGATVASIGLSVPVERFRAERREIIRRCRETAARASRALGFSGASRGPRGAITARPPSPRAA